MQQVMVIPVGMCPDWTAGADALTRAHGPEDGPLPSAIDRGDCIVGLDASSGMVVACLAYHVDDRELCVDTMSVEPAWRGNGHMAKLVSALMHLTPNEHPQVRRLWSYAAADNGQSLTTFLRCAWRVCGFMADASASGGGWVYVDKRVRGRA